jgi:crotonobetainyl-CoA:carnitine CoA-transferase CaiB-like acyl-CoA transferase
MPTSAYPTSDGYLNIGAGGDVMWRALCTAIGQPDLAMHPDFLSDPDRVRNRAALNRILSDAFRTRSTAEWVKALDAADVPSGPIYTMDQVFADPQVQHCAIAEPVVHPERGTLRLISQVVKLERTPARIASTLEEKGGSTMEVLGELGFDPAAIERLQAAGAI